MIHWSSGILAFKRALPKRPICLFRCLAITHIWFTLAVMINKWVYNSCKRGTMDGEQSIVTPTLEMCNLPEALCLFLSDNALHKTGFPPSVLSASPLLLGFSVLSLRNRALTNYNLIVSPFNLLPSRDGVCPLLNASHHIIANNGLLSILMRFVWI